MREPDELDLRIRSLEAERLRRPVPAPKKGPTEAQKRLASLEKRLKKLGKRHHSDPEGPWIGTENDQEGA